MMHTYRTADFLKDFDWAATDFNIRQGRPFEGFPRGASGYFHERVIALNRAHASPPSTWISDDVYFLELLYAVLTAWGMASQKARLVDFPDFAAAVRGLVVSPAFVSLQADHLRSVRESWKERLTYLWQVLMSEGRIMASQSILVGSSKLLHHLLPDLFPPIDRSYTLDFLASLSKDDPFRISVSDSQRAGFDAFYTAMRFFGHVARSVQNVDWYVGKGPMSASIPKVIDNALITWWGTE